MQTHLVRVDAGVDVVVPHARPRVLLGIRDVVPILLAQAAHAVYLLLQLCFVLFHPDDDALVAKGLHLPSFLTAPSDGERRADSEQAVRARRMLRPRARDLRVKDAAVLRAANVPVCERERRTER